MGRRQRSSREARPAGGLSPLLVRSIPGGQAHLAGLRTPAEGGFWEGCEEDACEPHDREQSSHDMPSMGGKDIFF